MWISEVEVGDTVYAYDPDTGTIEEHNVVNTFVHDDDQIVYLTIDGEEIETTPWHPWWSVSTRPYTDDGWEDAGDLEPGDLILSLDGDYGVVERVVITDETQTLYDLDVATVDTFAVGDGAWVVHNADGLGCAWYATYQESGLNKKLQDSIAGAIRQTDPDMIIAVRSRALYADYFEGVFPNKPMGADNIRKLNLWGVECGVRLCRVPDGYGGHITGTFLSDLDIGFAVTKGSDGNWRNVPDNDFISMSAYLPNGQPRPGALPVGGSNLPGNIINTAYGQDVVMHGALVNGFLDGIIPYAKRYKPLLSEPMFAFDSRGYLQSGRGIDLFGQVVPNDLRRITGG